MFGDLKNLFSRSWKSFQDELSRREPEDRVAELLTAMRREMVEARATLPVLEQEVERVRQELARERGALADCRRRRGLAERIGDADTVRVAEEFAERHARRVEVLEERLRAAQAERELRAEEIERMSREYKKADANRFALLARLRAVQAQGRMGAGSAELFDELSRMEEGVEHRAAYAEALEEVEGPAAGPSGPSAPDVEERLRELKRRMGRE